MQKNQVWRVSATVLSLTAFSYFAGLGVRGLYGRLSQSEHTDERSFSTYTRVASANPRVSEPDLRPLQLYTEVLKRLQAYYVESLPPDTLLARGSVDAMLNQLNDPNTRFLSKQEVSALQAATVGEYTGLGAVLTVRRSGRTGVVLSEDDAPPRNTGVKTITVVSVAPGGPADKVGLKPGDRITEIDGRWIAPTHVSYRVLTQLTDPLGQQDGRPRTVEDDPEPVQPPDEREKQQKELEDTRTRWKNAAEMPLILAGFVSEGKGEHELTVERGYPSRTHKVRVSLGATRVATFSSRKLDPATGYVQIHTFNAGTPQKLGEALDEFQKTGVKNLVVDLRNSPGGTLEAARDAAGLLVGSVRFATLKRRDAARRLVEQPFGIQKATRRMKPARVVVLVDRGTAGSSELFAAALRDHLGAKLVGSGTFGDGSEHDVIRLEDGSGVAITRARMLTSKGVDFEGKGLKPDVATQGDPLEAAVKSLAAARPNDGSRALGGSSS